jgi:phosphatidylglycerophosphate synthase
MIERSDKIVTCANLITFSGIITALASIYLVWQGQKNDLITLLWFVLAYIYTAISDLADGEIARRFGISALGEIMDPARDKLIVLVILIVSWQIFIVVAVIEMTSIYFSGKVRKLARAHVVTKTSKWVTTFQFLVIGILGILYMWPTDSINYYLLWLICLLSCIRLGSYFHEYNRLKLMRSNGF